MLAALKSQIQLRILPSHIAVVVLLGIALVAGVMTPVMVTLLNGQLSKLAAVPAVLVLGFLLVLDRKMMMMLIILLRSSGDIFLSNTRFTLGGANLGVGGLINAAVILIAIIMIAEKPKEVPRYAYTSWLPFLLLAGIGIFASAERGDTLRYWLTEVSVFAMFLSAFHFVRTKEDFIYCVKLVLWSSLIPVLYAFYDFAAHHSQGGEDGFRLRSTFSHFNILAFYLTIIISLTFYMLKSLPKKTMPGRNANRHHYLRVMYGVYIFVLLGELMLTKTRSAWLACGIGFFLYGVFFERRYIVYLVAGGMLGLLLPEVRDRLDDLLQGNHVGNYAQLNSLAWRQYLWRSGLESMSPSHYLFGYGLQAFQQNSDVFFPLSGGIKWGAHSVYVQFLYEIGLIGTIAFLWSYAKALGQLVKMLKIDKLAAFSLIVIVINFLICAASDNMIDYLSFNWYLWFVVGAGCALVREKPASVARPYPD